VKALLLLAGVLALAFGLLFAGQGLGYVRWPSESFMIGQTSWVYYGAAIAIAGIFLIRLARR
jgi:hypothetical protein